MPAQQVIREAIRTRNLNPADVAKDLVLSMDAFNDFMAGGSLPTSTLSGLTHYLWGEEVILQGDKFFSTTQLKQHDGPLTKEKQKKA